MLRLSYLIYFSLIISILLHSITIAEENAYNSLRLGLRLGTSNTNERDFRSVEIFGSYGLQHYNISEKYSKLVLTILLNTSFGGLKQRDDIGGLATFGPGLALSTYSEQLYFDIGGGLAFLIDEKIGNHDFGSFIQYSAHGGLSYKFYNNLFLGYRFFHISDGGIFDGHGLNRHLFELGYRF